jgi:hypothetical protein
MPDARSHFAPLHDVRLEVHSGRGSRVLAGRVVVAQIKAAGSGGIE